jgi:CelD/BcsL family acetyltransferase involved in cellulose biosynthesis
VSIFHFGGSLIRTRVARSAAEIEGLRAPWDSIWNPDLTLFQSYLWNELAAKIFAKREAPYVVFAESDSGIAILPAAINIEHKQICFLGETLFDYRDYLSCGEPRVLQAAWGMLTQLGLPIEILAIRRPDARIWSALPKSLYSGAPYLSASSTTPEQFSAMHTRKGSRLRRLFRMGIELRVHSGDETRLAEHIYRCKGAQGGAGSLFADDQRRSFMCGITQREGAKCEIFTFEKGSEIVAALVAFRDGRYRRFYTTYYDHQWARYSPGVELLFEATRCSLEDQLDVDFMTGDQPYKMRIANMVAPLYRVEASAEQLLEGIHATVAADRAA